MRVSTFLLSTVKETPSDAEIISHQLMLRAGMVRKIAAGIYTWLPLGLRVMRKVENIVREEMNRAGAQEILMPAVQPAELWRESGRWEEYGPELLRLRDRHERDFCFGPTHEEIITELVRREIKSYRQLPANFYQVQTKFRDEIRPRFGVMRAREFVMKDAYSFHISQASLQQTYDIMFDAYKCVFSRIGLEFCAVEAHGGVIGGGNVSHEFHVLADSGEDAIASCSQCDYAANVDLAITGKTDEPRSASNKPMSVVDTPDQHTIESLSQFLKIDPAQTIKTLLVKGVDDIVALVIRGDHELNVVKAEKLPQVQKPLSFATAEEVQRATGCEPGFIGPVGLKVPIIADTSAAQLSDFVCGANEEGKHLQNVNWESDATKPEVADIRNVVQGDPCPRCAGVLNIRRGIEVGHVFQLGTKYSKSMGASVLDEAGEAVAMSMGCYGIGVSRVVAAAIEQSHDENGIIWPGPIAPFDLCLVPIGINKSAAIAEASEKLYQELRDASIDVLFDDRNERPGVMFADMDLVGIPHRLVLGERGLKNGVVEYKSRRKKATSELPLSEVVNRMRQHLNT